MGYLKKVALMNGKGLLFLMRGGNPQSAMFVVEVLWEIVVLPNVFIFTAPSKYIASLWLLLDLTVYVQK